MPITMKYGASPGAVGLAGFGVGAANRQNKYASAQLGLFEKQQALENQQIITQQRGLMQQQADRAKYGPGGYIDQARQRAIREQADAKLDEDLRLGKVQIAPEDQRAIDELRAELATKRKDPGISPDDLAQMNDKILNMRRSAAKQKVVSPDELIGQSRTSDSRYLISDGKIQLDPVYELEQKQQAEQAKEAIKGYNDIYGTKLKASETERENRYAEQYASWDIKRKAIENNVNLSDEEKQEKLDALGNAPTRGAATSSDVLHRDTLIDLGATGRLTDAQSMELLRMGKVDLKAFSTPAGKLAMARAQAINDKAIAEGMKKVGKKWDDLPEESLAAILERLGENRGWAKSKWQGLPSGLQNKIAEQAEDMLSKPPKGKSPSPSPATQPPFTSMTLLPPKPKIDRSAYVNKPSTDTQY